MRIIYDLQMIGIASYQKEFIDDSGTTLSVGILNTILSLLTSQYLSSEFKTFTINSKKFNKIAGNYTMYLNFLKYHNLIYTGSYEVGVHSREFLFTDFFAKIAIIKEVKLAKDKKLHKHEYFVRIDESVRRKLYTDIHALDVIDKTVKKEYEGDYVKFKSYISNIVNLYRFQTGNLYFKWISGRLFTPFTECSKEIRLRNFRFGNDNLASFDIPNSYPLFLSFWLMEKGIDVTDIDFIDWCDNIIAGRDSDGKSLFYKELRKKLNQIKDLYRKEKYDAGNDIITATEAIPVSFHNAKLIFQRWLNGKEKNDIVNNLFQQYYPCIYQLVNHKYIMYDELVQKETDFMMNVIVKRFYTEIKGIKIVTCHDELYFQAKFKEQAEIIWKEELDKLYSQLPVTKEEEEIDYKQLGIFDEDDDYILE